MLSDQRDFEILCAGSRAEADDEEGALCAARELRRDHRNGFMAKAPEVIILFQGKHALTIAQGQSV